jgi:hypothetical protein
VPLTSYASRSTYCSLRARAWQRVFNWVELLKALVPNLSKVALLREDVTTSALPQIPAQYGEEVAIGLGASAWKFIRSSCAVREI